MFDQARKSTPCVVVLEDLDSMLTDRNRSQFLNELDGFAGHAGVLTLATTNHPERLDPAILERPSRFDRTYHFDLPGSWVGKVSSDRRRSTTWKERASPRHRHATRGSRVSVS